MSVDSAFAALRRTLDARIVAGAKAMGRDWQAQAKVTAPTGPTGRLQAGMTFSVHRVFGSYILRLSGDVPYARKQQTEALTHVPPDVVGVKGWQDFATIRGNRSRRYYSGLRAALAAGSPRYRWDYPAQAFQRAGGMSALRRLIKGA